MNAFSESGDNLRQYDAMLLGAEMGDPPEVDLHKAPDTHDGVQMAMQFVDRQFMAGEQVVRLIHGRGTGRMRTDVQRALAESDLVEHFRDSSKPGEQMAVTYAVLAAQN